MGDGGVPEYSRESDLSAHLALAIFRDKHCNIKTGTGRLSVRVVKAQTQM